jgi:putative tricarboxylic transport membrane protein
MLLVLNLPLVGLWARLVHVPYAVMGPMILVFSVLGAYGVRNTLFDVGVAVAFGVVGYVMAKLAYPTAPLVLALILTPLGESALRQTLSMAGGSPVLLVTRPLAAVLIAGGIALTVWSLLARRTAPAAFESD